MMTEEGVLTAPFEPRPYQVPAFQALMSGKCNRIVTVWHRRAGKDMTAFNALWILAAQYKANYGYFFPYATQGRKAIWHGITNEQMSFREYIPKELVEHTHDTDMRITLNNGSTIQFIGTDNIDAKMGMNFYGVVMSEYAIQDPLAWDLIEPILLANGGWAWFPYTPRGRENHGYTMYQAASALQEQGEPWFCELLTIDDTGFIHSSMLDALRLRGVAEEIIQQEYYCNFGVSNFGAYFARQIHELEDQGRMNNLAVWNPNQLVHTAWDLGVRDSTCIWFIQEAKYGQWVAIDYHDDHSKGLLEYLKVLQDKPYYYGTHLVPHDASKRDSHTGTSFPDAAWDSAKVHLTVVPRTSRATQIDAGHRLIPQMHFNLDTTERGVTCLKNYTRQWDDTKKVFKDVPLHNWASHGTEAFLTFATGLDLIGRDDEDLSLATSSQGDFDARNF